MQCFPSCANSWCYKGSFLSFLVIPPHSHRIFVDSVLWGFKHTTPACCFFGATCFAPIVTIWLALLLHIFCVLGKRLHQKDLLSGIRNKKLCFYQKHFEIWNQVSIPHQESKRKKTQMQSKSREQVLRDELQIES